MTRSLDRRDFMKTGAAVIGAAAASGHGAARASDGASILYFNGAILTMEGDAPQYVEAVAVKDGRIAFAGSRAAAQAARPPRARITGRQPFR